MGGPRAHPAVDALDYQRHRAGAPRRCCLGSLLRLLLLHSLLRSLLPFFPWSLVPMLLLLRMWSNTSRQLRERTHRAPPSSPVQYTPCSHHATRSPLLLCAQEDDPRMSRWTLSTFQFNRRWEFSWLALNLTPLRNQKIHWRSVPGSTGGSLGALEVANRCAAAASVGVQPLHGRAAGACLPAVGIAAGCHTPASPSCFLAASLLQLQGPASPPRPPSPPPPPLPPACHRGQIRFVRKGPQRCSVKLTISYEVPGAMAPFASVSRAGHSGGPWMRAGAALPGYPRPPPRAVAVDASLRDGGGRCHDVGMKRAWSLRTPRALPIPAHRCPLLPSPPPRSC